MIKMIGEGSRNLEPRYDSRKSFYGKAHVVDDSDGSQILYSYDTPVCKINSRGEVELLAQWDSSQTTLRHVKEFLQQNGFKVGSKSQIASMYGKKVERVSRKNRKLVREADYSPSYDDLADRPYMDYDGLDDAVNNTKELVSVLADFKDYADSIVAVKFEDYNDAIEAFGGASDADAYARKISSLTKSVRRLSDEFDEIVNRFGL